MKAIQNLKFLRAAKIQNCNKNKFYKNEKMLKKNKNPYNTAEVNQFKIFVF